MVWETWHGAVVGHGASVSEVVEVLLDVVGAFNWGFSDVREMRCLEKPVLGFSAVAMLPKRRLVRSNRKNVPVEGN